MNKEYFDKLDSFLGSIREQDKSKIKTLAEVLDLDLELLAKLFLEIVSELRVNENLSINVKKRDDNIPVERELLKKIDNSTILNKLENTELFSEEDEFLSDLENSNFNMFEEKPRKKIEIQIFSDNIKEIENLKDSDLDEVKSNIINEIKTQKENFLTVDDFLKEDILLEEVIEPLIDEKLEEDSKELEEDSKDLEEIVEPLIDEKLEEDSKVEEENSKDLEEIVEPLIDEKVEEDLKVLEENSKVLGEKELFIEKSFTPEESSKIVDIVNNIFDKKENEVRSLNTIKIEEKDLFTKENFTSEENSKIVEIVDNIFDKEEIKDKNLKVEVNEKDNMLPFISNQDEVIPEPSFELNIFEKRFKNLLDNIDRYRKRVKTHGKEDVFLSFTKSISFKKGLNRNFTLNKDLTKNFINNKTNYLEDEFDSLNSRTEEIYSAFNKEITLVEGKSKKKTTHKELLENIIQYKNRKKTHKQFSIFVNLKIDNSKEKQKIYYSII